MEFDGGGREGVRPLEVASLCLLSLHCHSSDREDGEPADEIDVDRTVEESGVMSESEYLGSYESVAAYLRAMLESEVTLACAWIIEHLDYEAVRRRWESDGSRLLCERGRVYRIGARR